MPFVTSQATSQPAWAAGSWPGSEYIFNKHIMAIIIILQRTSERSSVSGMPLKGFSSDTMRRKTATDVDTDTARATDTDTYVC